MEIVGGGSVIELGPEQELHHDRVEHEWWQESVVLCWWDFEQGIGGYHRLGHQPFHRDGPKVLVNSNIFTPDCVYKRDEFVPLRDQDVRSDGFGTGDDTIRFEYVDHPVWIINEQSVQAELHVNDFYTPLDVYPKEGQLAEQIASGHMEVGSSISGSLQINGKQYDVNGLAFRDHGWGVRLWDVFVTHRWVAGTFGPNMTVLAVSVLGTDNTEAKFGCVIKDNKLIYTKSLDIVTYLETDGITHRGGHITLELTTGEVMEIELEVLQKGVVSYMNNMTVCDTMCKMKYKDLVGMCNFEISNNAARGTFRPYVAHNGFLQNGLHLL